MKLTNFKNKKNGVKTILLCFAFISLVNLFSSCTADELPTAKPNKQQILTAKDGDIVPPIIIKP